MITSWLSLCIFTISVLAIVRSRIHRSQNNEQIKIYAASSVLSMLCWANIIIIPSVLPGMFFFILVLLGILFVILGVWSFRQKIIIYDDQLDIRYLFASKHLCRKDIATVGFELSSEDHEDAYKILKITTHDGQKYDITRFDATEDLKSLLKDHIEDKSLTFRKIKNHRRLGNKLLAMVIFLSSILNVSYLNNNWVAYIRENITVSNLKVDGGGDGEAGF